MRVTKPLAIALTVFLFFAAGVSTMLGIGKTCVFSSVKARLTENGKPLKNVKVRREWDWNKPESDESVTDEDGIVTFPSVYESSISRMLPMEIVISQRLLVELNGELKEFWLNDKRDADENSEYDGAKFDVVCELTDEEKIIEAEVGLGKLTVCKLNKEG